MLIFRILPLYFLIQPIYLNYIDQLDVLENDGVGTDGDAISFNGAGGFIEEEVNYSPFTDNENLYYMYNDLSPALYNNHRNQPNNNNNNQDDTANFLLESEFGQSEGANVKQLKVAPRNIDQSKNSNKPLSTYMGLLDQKQAIVRNKKDQVLCRIQKTIHRHNDDNYEFFPKSYTSYNCYPVGQYASENSLSPIDLSSLDVCLVKSNICSTLHKKRFFLRKNLTETCWPELVSMQIGSGCDCSYHLKYRIHL